MQASKCLLYVDDVVRHTARQCLPNLARCARLSQSECLTEAKKLLHALVKPSPLDAVGLVTCVEERHTAAATFLESIRESREPFLDLLALGFETL